MTSTNHTLSGALIGAFLPLPVAVPVALVSHFLLDAIPHYAAKKEVRNTDSVYKTIIFSDTTIALFLGFIMIILGKWSMFIGAAAGYLPDVTIIYYYFKQGRNLDIKAENRFMRFHLGIQHEYPWGIIPELTLAVVMTPIFITQLLRT